MSADHGEASSSADVAVRMGLRITSLGPYRANLMAKGLVYAPQHGQIAYTVPGIANFVDRRRDELDVSRNWSLAFPTAGGARRGHS